MDRAALAAELRRARFRTTQFREGYAERDVDALLARLVRTLGGAWEARPTSAADGHPTTTSPSTAGTALPSAVTEPPRGLLSRLFGR